MKVDQIVETIIEQFCDVRNIDREFLIEQVKAELAEQIGRELTDYEVMICGTRSACILRQKINEAIDERYRKRSKSVAAYFDRCTDGFGNNFSDADSGL